MGKEIVINAQKDQMRIAIVEDGELAEMYFEDPNNERTLGDIHLGRVRRIMPSIKAAFIDVGQPSDAFLHFSDIADNVGDMLKLVAMNAPDVSKVELSPNTKAARRHRPRAPMGAPVSLSNEEDDAEEEASLENRKPSKPSRSEQSEGRDHRPESVLKRDQKILVKIVKEPISAKGSRVSTDISLAGRFLVLVPLADYVAVSKKIVSYKERRRLRALATSLLPKGFGLIVRTVAEGKNAKTLDTDLRLLIDKWRRIEKRMAEVKDPPALMHQDVNMVSSVIRDLFSDDYDRILVDDQKVYRNIKGYIQAVAPQMAPAVQMHSDRTPVFKAAGIEKAVTQAFESRVPLPSGGYLIIEHTEAMHVVDVNSGRAGKGLSQEQNSLKVNVEAARMIAQQLRVRDLGGIIVIDFIDLRDDKNRRKVHDELRREFTKDRAVTKVLPMSDFGVVQITRQRLRPSITTKKSTADAMKGLTSPVAASSGATPSVDTDQLSRRGRKDKPSITPVEMTAKIDKWLSRQRESGSTGALVLRVHPFARAFLQRGILNATRRWFAKYFIRIRIEEDESLEPMVFRFYDAKTNEELTRRKRSGRRRGKSNSSGDPGSDAEENQKRRSRTDSKSSDSRKSSGDRKSKDSKSVEDKPSRGKSDGGGRRSGKADDTGQSGDRSSGRSRQKSSRDSGSRSRDARKDSDARKSREPAEADGSGGDSQNGDRPERSDKDRSRGRSSRRRGGRSRSRDAQSGTEEQKGSADTQNQGSNDGGDAAEANASRKSGSRRGSSGKSSDNSVGNRSGDAASGQASEQSSEQPTGQPSGRASSQPSGDSPQNGSSQAPEASQGKDRGSSGEASASRPETVVFVSRHDPLPESRKSSVATEAPAKVESQASETQKPEKPAPKLYTSQHAPRTESTENKDDVAH